MPDIRQRIEADENWLEGLARNIPGFSGYKERDNRRAADQILRKQLANDLGASLKQLDHIKLHFTNQGQLEQLDDLDRFARKMSTLVDSIRYADYGITGFFDAIKIDEGDLDRLYEHDSSVAASLRELGQAIAGLQTATGENLPTLLDDIETRAEEIRDRWARREQIVTGLSEEGAP